MRIKSKIIGIVLPAVAVMTAAAPVAAATAQTSAASQRMNKFTQAAQEFHVPKEVLLSISYNESRWETHAGTSSDGGYGLMDLTTKATTHYSGKDGKKIDVKASTTQNYTLDKAAKLLDKPASTLQKDDTQNIRGGAAVLADYAKSLNGNKLPSDNDWSTWYAAVAKYGGSTNSQMAQDFADNIYTTMRSGMSRTTNDGQRLQLSKIANAKPSMDKLKNLHLSDRNRSSNNTDCPRTITCRFIPAAYAQTGDDPAIYGNYDPANRPKDMKIKYLIIHDTEGSYESAINAFQDPAYEVSANYIIRSSDGDVTQMVYDNDVSWGAADWYVNMHGINIEHEGVAADGSAWYTEKMYESSAKLVRYLAQKYNIPMDRQHIIGHDNVPGLTANALRGQHYDPGPYWDWNHYMALVHGVSDQTERGHDATNVKAGQAITINPKFTANQQTFQNCDTGTCTTLPTQASSAVPIHTQPSAASPLLSNPYTNAGGAGTRAISDWGDTASTGQTFVVADTQGDWTGIYFGDKIGWFKDANGDAHVSHLARHQITLAPKNNSTPINVYGGAYPENSVYPASVHAPNLEATYTMPADSRFALADNDVPTDYFYDATINFSKPYDHTIFRGHTRYYQISFNHRIAYVKASDVKLVWQ